MGKGYALNELPEHFTWRPVRVRARVHNPVTDETFVKQKTFWTDSREDLKSKVLKWLIDNNFRPDDVLSIRVYLD